VIIATSTLGSYALMRGISMYAGHYYSEVTVIQMIQDGQIKEIDTWYWAYVVGFVILLVLGACM